MAPPAAWPRPNASPPPQPLPELHQGYDTTTQITALADWLRAQPGPAPRRVWIATDPDHTARAVLLARLALERPKLWRDALRLTLWRATGSTGGWLLPEQVARKRVACGV